MMHVLQGSLVLGGSGSFFVLNVVIKIIVCEKVLELYTNLSIRGMWKLLLPKRI